MGVDKTSYGFFWIIFLPLPEMPECQPGQNEGGEEKSKWEQCGDFKPAFCTFSQCDPAIQRIPAKSSNLQHLKLYPSSLTSRLYSLPWIQRVRSILRCRWRRICRSVLFVRGGSSCSRRGRIRLQLPPRYTHFTPTWPTSHFCESTSKIMKLQIVRTLFCVTKFQYKEQRIWRNTNSVPRSV